MKIVNAVWEKENLGLTCQELLIEKGDTVLSIENVISELSAEYQIAKVPVGNVNILWYLQEQGFKYIECNLSFKKRINKKSLLSDEVSNCMQGFSCSLVEPEKCDFILKRIKTDLIFDTDKIALDPFLGVESSANRYYVWSKNVLNSGAYLYEIKKDDVSTGFFIIKKISDNVYDSFLGGFFSGIKNTDAGMVPLAFTVQECYNHGAKIIKTGTSSNNPIAMKMHLALGFELQKITYILVRHL